MHDSDFIIIGDTKEFKDCLVYVCSTKELAEENLYRILNNPNENDKKIMKGHTNFRIKEVPYKDCWWRHNCD